MTDSDFNSIKPVESLHSVHSLAPAQQREEQKRKQQPGQQPPQQQPENKPLDETPEEPRPSRNNSPHRIDYCA